MNATDAPAQSYHGTARDFPRAADSLPYPETLIPGQAGAADPRRGVDRQPRRRERPPAPAGACPGTSVREGSLTHLEAGKDGMRDNGSRPRDIAQQAGLRDLPSVTDDS